MTAPFVIAPNRDKAVDNGIVQMDVLVEPGRAEGFAYSSALSRRWGAGRRRTITMPTTRRSTCSAVRWNSVSMVKPHGFLPGRWHGCRVAPATAFATHAGSRRACWS